MKKYLYTIIWISVTGFIFYRSKFISDITYTTVFHTAKNILPVLFPYSILASLMVSLGINSVLSKIIPVNKLFMLPDIASPAILTGAICGFPLGSKVICEMYEKRICTKEEAEIILSVSSFAGPAFVINVIGEIYFRNIEVGIVIYTSQLIAALLSSFIVNGEVRSDTIRTHSQMPFGTAVSKAIESSVISCLYICGYITVFSIFVSSVNGIPIELKCIISAILEFSSASKFSSGIPGKSGLFLAAFSVGWSGLSVLFQTMSMTSISKLSLKRYIKVKLLTGILCGLFTVTYYTELRYASALIVLLVLFLAFAFRKNSFDSAQFTRKSI